MRRKLLCLLLTLVLSCSFPCLAELGSGLQLEFQQMYLTETWQEQDSSTHVYFVLPVTLVNWETEPVSIPEMLSLRLSYAGKYEFEGTFSFENGIEIIEPLVELDGNLVVRVPNMVAEHPENAVLQLQINQETQILPVELGAYPRGNTGSFEGAGFSTPEEAALAYIAAMRENDLAGMASTFAIETKVDHMDTPSYLERLRASTAAAWASLPAGNDYARQILASKAYADIINSLYYQYISYTSLGTEYQDTYADGKPQQFSAENLEEEIDRFVTAMGDDCFSTALQSCEFVDWIDPSSLSETYMAEANQRNIQRQAACYGMDEVRHLCAQLRIDGEYWLLCMECARYGDRWYNSNLSGNMSVLLGISTFCGGLIPMDALD